MNQVLRRTSKMANEPEEAMAAAVGGMPRFRKPIARQDQELLNRAVECFGDLDKAIDWLQSPNAALRDLSPLRTAATPEGRQSVLDELGRIEHGVFA
jgi:hypothetical protein